ncbi:MAG: hypothetical protein K0R51_2231 [Cytophagaceae bacterium]|jgi:hypothetical protein|nr:hypothetical protein [Cytophagaceae bacterium]
MKKLLTPLLLVLVLANSIQAQTAQTALTGSGYGNNVWYSLENGTVATESATNWDIALAASASMSGALTSSVLFNPKKGIVCVAPVTVANFATLDTTGMTWTPLYNSDKTWATGAFNNAAGASQFDFGFGTYNTVNHSLEASRVFVTRAGSPGSYTCTKLYLTLNTLANTYTLTYSKLDNTDSYTETLPIATYATKNFLYYSFAANAIVDREPAKTTWDLLFTQYVSTSEGYGSTQALNQTITGVLVNHGVQVAQANNVDQATYTDHGSLTFSADINTIGFDWKILNGSTFAWHLVTDTVYFVKQTDGDIYKLYFTSFVSGSSPTTPGAYNFTQEKMSTVTGLFNSTDKASLAVYPNPTATGNATLIYDFSNNNNAVLTVSDLTGNVVYTENIQSASGLNAYTFSTASLTSGLYVVSLNTNGGVLQQKLMVK